LILAWFNFLNSLRGLGGYTILKLALVSVNRLLLQ